MYLPKNLQIVSPYVSRWYGQSGRQYEFGVVRSASIRFDEAAVYVLAKHDGNMIVPLSVGRTEGSQAGSDDGMPAEWIAALAEGMSHVHVRFEAHSEAARQAEVHDLAVALRPLLNVPAISDSSLIRLSPHRPVEVDALAKPHSESVSEAGSAGEQDGPAPARSWYALAKEWGAHEWSVWSRARTAAPAVSGADMPQVLPLELPLELGESETPVSDSPAWEQAIAEAADADPSDDWRAGGTLGKADFGFDPSLPLALFADELSMAAGADILVDAAITVAHDDRPINLLFVGDGPLKGELEARVSQAGVAGRVRFVGDAGPEVFTQLFAVADFVIIPARTPRDGILIRRAAAAGKPVLTTHQGWVDGIEHGRNGLVTYDNPGSFVWGLRELVHCMWVPVTGGNPVPQSEAA